MHIVGGLYLSCATTLLRTTLKAVTVNKTRQRVSPMKEELEVRVRGGRGGVEGSEKWCGEGHSELFIHV